MGVTVVGMGNVLLKDDGVGVWLVRELLKRPLPGQVGVHEVGTSVFALPSLVDAGSRTLVVDALDGGGTAGTAYTCSFQDLLRRREGTAACRMPVHALHELRLPDLLSTPEFQGASSGRVFGVQPGRIDYGYGLTPRLEALLPRLEELLRREIAGMLGTSRP